MVNIKIDRLKKFKENPQKLRAEWIVEHSPPLVVGGHPSIMSRYAKKMVISKYYGKISIRSQG